MMETPQLLFALAMSVSLASAQVVPSTSLPTVTTTTTTTQTGPPPTLSPQPTASNNGTVSASRSSSTSFTSTTAAPIPTASPIPIVCIPLTGSTSCPSFAGFSINSLSRKIAQQVGAGDRTVMTVADFDIMVEKHAHAAPGSMLAEAGCETWDASYIRYGDQYHCDYFLGDPYVVGNCNADSTGLRNVPGLPRISNATCTAFHDSVFDYISDKDLCVGTTTAGRKYVEGTIQNYCGLVFDEVLAGNAVEIDMGTDSSPEHFRCGFGTYQSNVTETLISAFDYCQFVNATESCCQYDEELLTYLKQGHLPEPVIPDIYNCQVRFNRFFLVSCGQLLGTIFGTLMGFASIGIIWWGVQRQDKEAMRNTISGRAKEESKWMWQWFNSSALANPAASVVGSTASDLQGKGSNQSLQPGSFAKERREFQRFDHENGGGDEFTAQQFHSHSRRAASAGGGVAGATTHTRRGSSATGHNSMKKSRSQSRSPIRQSPSRSGNTSQGVDPFAEMMGGLPVSMDSAVPSYTAAFDFYGKPGSPEMDRVRVGDRLVVLEVRPRVEVKNGGAVAVARNLSTGKQGIVPMNILAR
ncbi:UNVERIFIED_CONTAM: hypothetical protein HDU68_001666 [Siphonaria sp. JEL0065]|nr:hypothetical protein HDU68_001666 [Siphonaria sp. JEL0065]